LYFNSSVTEVSDPAAKTKIEGSLAAAVPKSHPLNSAFDQEAPSFFEWLLALTRAPHESAAICVATVSSAARHRHEIVEELAQ
jgi:hypothetical protein